MHLWMVMPCFFRTASRVGSFINGVWDDDEAKVILLWRMELGKVVGCWGLVWVTCGEEWISITGMCGACYIRRKDW